MPESTITVVPTGGSVAIDLADLAQDVVDLQATAPSLEISMVDVSYVVGWYASYNKLSLYVFKQTGVMEAISFYIDGSSTALVPDGGSPTGGPWLGNLPDGILTYSWMQSLPASTGTAGNHSILVKTSITNTEITANYTI